MAPFTQIVFKPLNEGQINNIITTGLEETDVQDVYSKTIVNIMKNHYNQLEVRIPLPGDEYQTDSSIDWNNELRITKLEILVKESDQDVVKVVKEIDVNDDLLFTSLLETRPILQDNISTTYYRHVYKYVYKSEEPYKILEDKQITRVFDQVPLRAKSQEISGNRIIYGNFTENYELPVDSNGKSGINYVINSTSKGDTAINSIFNNNPQFNKAVYKNHSIKQKRKYQVGIVFNR